MLKPESRFVDEDDVLDGVFIGVVTNNKDPLNQGRVKVRFPWLDDEIESNWARLATLYAGNGRGSYFVPEVGDEVLLAFELGDMNQPFVIGSLWNGKDVLPEPGHPDGKDNHKVIETRSGHKVTFDDTEGNEVISIVDSSKNNRFVIDVAADAISITAVTGDIFIKAPAGSVNFQSKSQGVNVSNSKQHTTGANHSIKVSKGSYTQTISSAKSLTVGGGASRSAKSMAASATTSASVSGGSASFEVKDAGTMTQSGPVTQTMGSVKRTLKVDMEKSPVKTWTCGVSTFHADQIVSIEAAAITLTTGLLNGKAGGGQFSLLGSPVVHLGGLLNFKAGQIAFKPGG
jgi:hypothetical protein